MTTWVALCVALTALACDAKPKPTSVESTSPAIAAARPEVTQAPAAKAAPAPTAQLPPPLPELEGVVRSWRCAECHEKMYEEWRESPHAKAATGELYSALAKLTNEHACNNCHAPLKRRVKDETAAAEGVSCEVCHRMHKVAALPTGAGFELEQREAMKYGPLCDPAYPYFHEADCRDHFEESAFCGSCHLLHQPLPSGASLPVYTEYEEWQASAYAKRGQSCQSCHMPGERAAIASGEDERDDVGHHNFLGGAASIVGTGLSATARVSSSQEGVKVAVELHNRGAGHALPGVHRQLVLHVRFSPLDGADHNEATAVYERQFVNEKNEPVPFFLAARIAKDTRILPQQRIRESFTLKAATAGVVSIKVLRHRLAPKVARRLDIDVPDPQVVLASEVSFGPPQPSGARPSLPKKMKLVP